MTILPKLYTVRQLKKFRDNLVKQLEQAKDGYKSSLTFSKTTLDDNTILQEGDKFQLMIIGGSNYKSALGDLRQGQLSVKESQQCKLPKFHKDSDLGKFL
ncbi:hypothetical protein HC864_03210 [Candidatus Gracilibacteria bacterium]|nr:hypothetical protein [Candidatus Gracilibacteria bacterium]